MHTGMKLLSLFVLLAWASTGANAAPKHDESTANATAPLAFVQSYVTELMTFENLKVDAAKELDDDKAHPQMACIHSGERYDLEVSAAINMLRNTRLVGVDKQLQDVPQLFADLYRQRRTAMAHMTAICTAFAGSPEPGVDYAALAAEMPKIRADLEYLDKIAFDSSPLVFATLISDVPDSQGHASHLVISCDDRKRLVDQIDSDFGEKLAAKDGDYYVSQAQILRAMVLEHKCAEESR